MSLWLLKKNTIEVVNDVDTSNPFFKESWLKVTDIS